MGDWGWRMEGIAGWENGGGKGKAYDDEGADEDVMGGFVLGIHLLDEVAGHADDGDEGEDLEDSGAFEGCAEGAVVWACHGGVDVGEWVRGGCSGCRRCLIERAGRIMEFLKG